MTLRLRLVLALGGLLAIGLGLFGAATYAAYRSSQFGRLDEQLTSVVAPIRRSLEDAAGFDDDPDELDELDEPDEPGEDQDRPSRATPAGAYGELRDASGSVVAVVGLADGVTPPELPASFEELPVTFTSVTADGANGVPGRRRAGTPTVSWSSPCRPPKSRRR